MLTINDLKIIDLLLGEYNLLCSDVFVLNFPQEPFIPLASTQSEAGCDVVSMGVQHFLQPRHDFLRYLLDFTSCQVPTNQLETICLISLGPRQTFTGSSDHGVLLLPSSFIHFSNLFYP